MRSTLMKISHLRLPEQEKSHLKKNRKPLKNHKKCPFFGEYFIFFLSFLQKWVNSEQKLVWICHMNRSKEGIREENICKCKICV